MWHQDSEPLDQPLLSKAHSTKIRILLQLRSSITKATLFRLEVVAPLPLCRPKPPRPLLLLPPLSVVPVSEILANVLSLKSNLVLALMAGGRRVSNLWTNVCEIDIQQTSRLTLFIQLPLIMDPRKTSTLSPVCDRFLSPFAMLTISTGSVCDTLTNSCGADQSAKNTCAKGQAAASAAAKGTGAQADAFNVAFGINTVRRIGFLDSSVVLES